MGIAYHIWSMKSHEGQLCIYQSVFNPLGTIRLGEGKKENLTFTARSVWALECESPSKLITVELSKQDLHIRIPLEYNVKTILIIPSRYKELISDSMVVKLDRSMLDYK